jgi:hypothetical protein
MKVAEFNKRFDFTTTIDFFSRQTLLEYDALIFDLSILKHNEGQIDLKFYEERKRELEEFTRLKKMPIIYLAEPLFEIRVISNNQLVKMPIGSLLPISTFETISLEGKEYATVSNTPFSDFFQKYKECFSYNIYFKQYVGKSILTTPYTSKVLSFYDDRALFLPILNAFMVNRTKPFFQDLIECVKNIIPNSDASALPKWAESYYLPGELTERKRIDLLINQIRNLESEVKGIGETISFIEQTKRIFTTSGQELERKVEFIFSELGFEILETEPNRDDLIVRHKDKIAVIEIKGLTNSAGEKNAAQLEKWRTIYVEKHDVNPKGILVVNTFKDTPLKERTQADFPDQMIRYAEGREHCLITTLQLLSLYYYVLENPSSKDSIVSSLFNCIGRYSATPKWQDYIDVKSVNI